MRRILGISLVACLLPGLCMAATPDLHAAETASSAAMGTVPGHVHGGVECAPDGCCGPVLRSPWRVAPSDALTATDPTPTTHGLVPAAAAVESTPPRACRGPGLQAAPLRR